MMDDQDNRKRATGADFFPILMVNSIMWAIAIIVTLVVLHDTGYFPRLFPVLAGGAVVSIVAVSQAWRKRKKTAS